MYHDVCNFWTITSSHLCLHHKFLLQTHTWIYVYTHTQWTTLHTNLVLDF